MVGLVQRNLQEYFARCYVAVHTTKCIKQVFTENNIRIFEWLAELPDINLIENLWKYVKDS